MLSLKQYHAKAIFSYNTTKIIKTPFTIMNKTKSKPSIGEGWAVHVYDSDRHLRFTLEPSHIWTFSWGIGVGLLLATVGSALYSTSHSSDNTKHLNPAPTPELNSEEGLRAEPASLFPLGID